MNNISDGLFPAFDEITGRRVFPKGDLRLGAYYMGRGRNACIARWDADRDQFILWRHTFGLIFLDFSWHPDDNTHFDVFRVIRDIPDPNFEIPLDRNEYDRAKFHGIASDLDTFNEETWCICPRPGCFSHDTPSLGQPRLGKVKSANL